MGKFKTFILTHSHHPLIRLLILLNAKVSLKPYQICLLFFKRSLSDDIAEYQRKMIPKEVIRIEQKNTDRLLTEKILQQILQENGSRFTWESLFEKIRQGGVLFVGVGQDHQVVHHTWVEQGRIKIEDIYCNCILKDDIAYFASSYTPQKYRKLGMGAFMRSHVLRYCKEKGFKEAMLTIEVNNLASIKLAKSQGFQEYQKVFFGRFLGLKFYKIKDSHTGKLIKKFGNQPDIWNFFFNNYEFNEAVKEGKRI